MPRGGHKVIKPAKAPQVDNTPPLRLPGIPSMTTKTTKTNTERKPSSLVPTFLSPSWSGSKLSGSATDLPTESARIRTGSECDQGQNGSSTSLPTELQPPVRPTSSRTPSVRSIGEEDTPEPDLDTFQGLATEATQSSASSTYSRDSTSIYSRNQSVYSSASSIYSSEAASIYSFDECEESDRYPREGSTELMARDADGNLDPRLPAGMQYQRRTSNLAVRRQDTQDAATRERSSLAKKAALFKNSRLPPQLPSFSASIPTWTMVCRAVRASQDCYDSQTLTRRGIYTPADSSKDIKAMIVDDQLIDGSRLVIVSIRGTQCQSLTDWTCNMAANPAKPVGFLDDEENACHAGFLQVTKAMVAQVAAQLKQHPACAEKPSLLFTGHSAGGAVAAMLYSHMLSTTVQSDLTTLATQFPSVNCITFGAPPLSLTPLPRRDNGSGVFLSFANEGDPVLRLSNAAYLKSLAKLMTASPPPPPSTANIPVAPPVKVVRGSRGATVYRQALPPPPPTPWEELPLWPTPPPPLTNAGDVVLLRDNEKGLSAASRVTPEDLKDVIFGDLVQHTVEMYIRRVKEVTITAMMGR